MLCQLVFQVPALDSESVLEVGQTAAQVAHGGLVVAQYGLEQKSVATLEERSVLWVLAIKRALFLLVLPAIEQCADDVEP